MRNPDKEPARNAASPTRLVAPPKGTMAMLRTMLAARRDGWKSAAVGLSRTAIVRPKLYDFLQ